jgi:hypothetical protein
VRRDKAGDGAGLNSGRGWSRPRQRDGGGASSAASKGPFGRAYFSASALAHAKVVPNTSFSNGFTSEVIFQNELEGMSQKKWLTRLQLTSFLHNSPPTSPSYYFLVLPSIPSHVQERYTYTRVFLKNNL